MAGVLTVVFAFIIFMIIMGKGYLATLNPVSLAMLIVMALVVGYVLAHLVMFLFGSFFKMLIFIVIATVVVKIFLK